MARSLLTLGAGRKEVVILFIDTSEYDYVRIALIGEGIVWHKSEATNLSQSLLPEIKKFFKKEKVNFDELEKIAVVVGPGGFSRIRTAVAVANALGFGLNLSIIPVSKDKIPSDLAQLKLLKGQKMVAPIYDREPNITMSKK